MTCRETRFLKPNLIEALSLKRARRGTDTNRQVNVGAKKLS